MIETYAYARAGLLGNPSDGYFGKTIAFLVRNFRARVLLYPSARLEITASKADMPVFESLEDLHTSTRWRGYYGGIRIIQALIVRFLDYGSVNMLTLKFLYPLQVNLGLETKELAVPAGTQDRVIQVYEGLVYIVNAWIPTYSPASISPFAPA